MPSIPPNEPSPSNEGDVPRVGGEIVQNQDEIVEDVPPGNNGPAVVPVPVHRETVRSWLAVAMLVLLGLIVAIGLYGWVAQDADLERMQSLALVFSPVVTLMGTILGFYFASDRN